MKPRIFIAMHYMEIGGAETALVGLLNALDSKRVDVDLFIHDHRGEMMQFIPKWVNLIPPIPRYTVLERPVVELARRGFWSIAIARMLAKIPENIAYKRYINRTKRYSCSNSLRDKDVEIPENCCGLDKTAKMTILLLPKINPDTTYDIAISFLRPHRIVLDRVQAKKKIAWIHTDYSRIWVDADEELNVWSKYDYIASISEDVTNSFLKVYPSLSHKIILIENILSPLFVKNRAELNDVSSELTGDIKLLSVGRFSNAKNYDNVPDICRRLITKYSTQSSKQNIKWYIIGYGGDEPIIRQRIKETCMEEHVIILGKKDNPYPYIKTCDIYVQPSRYEGKSVTVREAQMLCKPVVVTNYPTASSQIKNCVDGVIVPMDNDGCAKGIAEVINDRALQEKLKNYLQTHDYGNESEVTKIYSLMNL